MPRLDAALVARGLVSTRSRALDLIRRGFVSVGGVVVTSDAETTCGAGSLTTAAAATAKPPSDIAATMAPATLTRTKCDDQKFTIHPFRRR